MPAPAPYILWEVLNFHQPSDTDGSNNGNMRTRLNKPKTNIRWLRRFHLMISTFVLCFAARQHFPLQLERSSSPAETELLAREAPRVTLCAPLTHWRPWRALLDPWQQNVQ
ncbi:hypothetical protein NDU88_004336 [Pleurodeles waltl]|uniref:Uncharacterized protein n=1 Tax=Pleurodeles waltl TaxID=8319 RepID=A0AAV7TSA9_PLEWA|nr:hypothetical protein NDU88_004336 [Pleurodeles waltl]